MNIHISRASPAHQAASVDSIEIYRSRWLDRVEGIGRRFHLEGDILRRGAAMADALTIEACSIRLARLQDELESAIAEAVNYQDRP